MAVAQYYSTKIYGIDQQAFPQGAPQVDFSTVDAMGRRRRDADGGAHLLLEAAMQADIAQHTGGAAGSNSTTPGGADEESLRSRCAAAAAADRQHRLHSANGALEAFAGKAPPGENALYGNVAHVESIIQLVRMCHVNEVEHEHERDSEANCAWP